MDKRVLGAIVLLLTITAIVLLAQVYCYEIRACEGSPQSYTTYMMGVTISLFILFLVYAYITESRKTRR